MQSAHLDGGTAGTRWTEYDATSKELLWSVQPRPSAEERKQLLSLIPSLIKRINAGLDLLAIPAEERTPFLNACFDLQTAALRTRPDAPGVPAQPPVCSCTNCPCCPEQHQRAWLSLQIKSSNGTGYGCTTLAGQQKPHPPGAAAPAPEQKATGSVFTCLMTNSFVGATADKRRLPEPC